MIRKTPTGPLFYNVSGKGSPLVFFSGWAMASDYWRPVVALLERKYRCLIFDYRGVGRSQPVSLDATFDIEDHAADLHDVLEIEGIFDAIFIGHEIGALVAGVCATRHPQDIRAMALVSPRAGVTESELKRLAVFTPAALALRELASYPLIRNVIAWRFRRAPRHFRDILFSDFANLNPRAAYETALSFAGEGALARLEAFLRKSQSPSLIICGEKDRGGMAEARRLFTSVRAGKLATMGDSGFLPMLEYPKQFARLLDDFARSVEAAGSRALSSVKPESGFPG